MTGTFLLIAELVALAVLALGFVAVAVEVGHYGYRRARFYWRRWRHVPTGVELALKPTMRTMLINPGERVPRDVAARQRAHYAEALAKAMTEASTGKRPIEPRPEGDDDE